VATATPLPTATPVPAHTGLVGEAPAWAKTVVVGALFAGVVAALVAAYYRRLYAAWWARVNAWFAAWRQQQDEAEAAAAQEAAAAPGFDPWEEAGDEGHPEVRGGFAVLSAASSPTIPPPPPEGTPERREWEEQYAHLRPDVQAEVARARAKIVQHEAAQPVGPSQASQGMILPEWKANEPFARDEAIQQAELDFNAKVGGLTPEAWYQAQQRAVALRIEQVQQQAREVCATKPGLACQIAWEQANQRILEITLVAGLRPKTPYLMETQASLPILSIGFGVHASGGIGVYGDTGFYVAAVDTTGDMAFLQLYTGGGGTTGVFGEVTPVVFISNAPLEKWPGWSVNVGGSIEGGVSVGADVVLWKDEQGHRYCGLQLTLPLLGVGGSPEFALPIEFHGGASYTRDPLWRLKR